MLDEIEVQALVREGRYEEAARVCLEGGQPARAADFLAVIWKHADAARIASDAGLFDEAYRHALASNDGELARNLCASLSARPEQASRAAEHAQARGRMGDAARLCEAAGQLDKAAALYERAGELDEAGRCAKEFGDWRLAGTLYERRLKEVPEDTATAFELGQILMRFGRWDHASRALQIASLDPRFAVPAGKLLVATFDALGLPDAAASRLDMLREREPQLPARVPDMLRETFGAEGGPRSADSETLVAERYRIIRPLGAGSTGRVVLAEDAFYGREVAIKVLHAGGSGAVGRDALLRFAREARVAAGIAHPNVVQVYEFISDGPFLVMEHMAEGTLEDRFAKMNQAPLEPSIARHVLRSVLSALEAVHRRGVVHRDLKPANIFFGRAGEVKLGDFGVAHLVDLGTTLTGAMMGTLAYMAPEQFTTVTRPVASTDLYALGVVLYRLLTGVLPFSGPDFMTEHLEVTPPPASTHAPWLDPHFDAFVGRMLEKDPALRPRTATEVLEAMDALPWARAERHVSREALAILDDDEPKSQPSLLPEADRYRAIETAPNGAITAVDELLERRVRILPCDSERAKALRVVAQADSPFLQAVWTIDTPRSRAVLEVPDGSGAQGRPLDISMAEVEEAVLALHARGLAHGAIDAEHIARGPGRTVLLIEDAPLAGSLEEDLSALAALRRALASS